MHAIPVITVFDVGKTNKKIFLFNDEYKIVYEKTQQFAEVTDEDGFPCENLQLLSAWIKSTYQEILKLEEYIIMAINFSSYGASFVHIDEAGKPDTPLYNYLKPFPEKLKEQFYNKYGGEDLISQQTASPSLGNLNSGLQLYRLKYEQPELFKRIKYSLHLPQFLSYLITGEKYSDITSIGCHTALWHFEKNDYHAWVYEEEIDTKLAPIHKGSDVFPISLQNRKVPVGVGLHDSSAALIPYLSSFQEPFILISTGTWCITLNPFNQSPLTSSELKQDCLSYMTFEGNPVKASRLFAGNEHEQQTKKIAEHFNVKEDFYKDVEHDAEIIAMLTKGDPEYYSAINEFKGGTEHSDFDHRNLSDFKSFEIAYHQFMLDIMKQQLASTNLVLKNSPVKRIFVDGGFSKNVIYMNLLSTAFPETEVFAASMAQATSVGAALSIHNSWNEKSLPNDIIELKYYSFTHDKIV